MQDVYEQLPSDWQGRILLQGAHSKQEMLSQHRKQIDLGEGSVLFGLASFSEGVDLPGDYCRHVVIAKLPFAVPDDPIEATLAEWIERSEEHTSELQSRGHLVCRLLLETKNTHWTTRSA